MHPSRVDTLCLSVATSALVLLFCGAPLGLALPTGLLLWLVFHHLAYSRITGFLGALLCLYPLFIGLIQVSHWRSGTQGVDFGIFSQLIYQVAQNNRFITSLISTEWQNFITHHFSPFLILLGGVAKLGVSSEATLITAHVVAVTCLMWGLISLWKTASSPPFYGLLLIATALVLPGVRRALGWETHDEVLALPFIIWSMVAHLKGRSALRLLLLFPPLLFKETFGLVMCTTSLAYFFSSTSSPKTASHSARRRAMLVALCGIVLFILLTGVFPRWLWVSTFDPSARLVGLHEFFDLNLLRAKARWIIVTFLPGAPFLYLHTKQTLKTSLVLFSPAAYNIGAIMSTNFPAMLDPYNYYSVTPAILGFCALSLPVMRHRHLNFAILSSLSIALLSGTTVRSSKIIRQAFSEPSAYSELRTFVPREAAVIVDDYTASVVADNSYVQRVFHARRSRSSFDFIVTSKSLPDHLSDPLKNRSVPCHETPRYQIRCRKRN
jgi:hypothetical protein